MKSPCYITIADYVMKDFFKTLCADKYGIVKGKANYAYYQVYLVYVYFHDVTI